MAKPKVSDGVQAAFKAYSDFIDLCRMLFAHKGSDDAAKKINEIIGKDNKFYEEAVADECEMPLTNLSLEDSVSCGILVSLLLTNTERMLNTSH